MNRKEIREKANAIVYRKDPALNLAGHAKSLQAFERIIESFGLEIAKAVAEECAAIAQDVSTNPCRKSPSEHLYTSNDIRVGILEYAKRLEVEK